MIKIPQMIIYAVVAFNITAFTGMLQMDLLIFNSPVVKAVAWVATIAAWALTYVNRNKFWALRISK